MSLVLGFVIFVFIFSFFFHANDSLGCLFGMPFLERTSLAPTTGPDALYSGLLECPVTTRITKHAAW